VSGYFLSLDADEDLQDIYAYSDEVWGARRAALYLTGLYEVFDQIGRNPAMGRLRRELGDDLRSFPHGSHVVFYMPWQGEVAIVRVLHGSMDFEALFDAYNPAAGIGGEEP
jgi:toxin ParE1/3/4